MNEFLTAKLYKKYSELFEPEEIRQDETKSCMAWNFECMDGWYDILDKAFSKFMLLENKPTILQVKEKFGTLRLYINGSEEANAIVHEAETSSGKTCEVCGAIGTIGSDHGWYSTLCDTHKKSL